MIYKLKCAVCKLCKPNNKNCWSELIQNSFEIKILYIKKQQVLNIFIISNYKDKKISLMIFQKKTTTTETNIKGEHRNIGAYTFF